MAEEVPVAAEQFAVWAETSTAIRPLLLLRLTFARLMDDVVVPYHQDERFFIDGVPVQARDLTRIKILKLGPGFDSGFREFNMQLRRGEPALQKLLGEQYGLRLEALLRQSGEDVTAQVLKAFDQKIKPSLSVYLGKREELISLAFDVFKAGMKLLGS